MVLASRKKKVNPMRVIAASFLGIILTGTVLLILPVSSSAHNTTGFLTALFTATSATCVTGLVVVDTATYWSGFGQTVILLLIQIGGLGFMTIISIFFFAMRRHVGLRERMVIMQSFNLNELDGVVRLIRHILIGTLFFEGIGAIVLTARFIPEFGFLKGLWRGVFHSVSAFCNAGFDIIGSRNGVSGIMNYADDPVILLAISALLIIGGLGFFVWEDIYRKRGLRKLQIHSKIAMIVTAILLIGGTVVYLSVEWTNTGTLGDFSLGKKIINAFFQSATTRTAGFNSLDQAALTDVGKAFTILLMLIGGGSGSTAGGIKTVTFGILLLSVFSTLRGRRDLVVFKRRIEQRQIINALALVTVCVMVTVVGGMAISAAEGLPFMDSFFETVSAYGTVGLSTGITAQLGVFSRCVIIICMFFGRVGVMTVSIALMFRNGAAAEVTYPTDKVMIG